MTQITGPERASALGYAIRHDLVSYREFRDPFGIRWEVWEVQPALLERRTGADGTSADLDRRTTARKRAPVAHELRFGWLVFEAEGAEGSEASKRRLAPVPSGWEKLDDEGLSGLLARASVRGQQPRVALSGDDSLLSPPVRSVSSGPAGP